MLKRAVIPLGLKEPLHKVLSMARCTRSFGTEELLLVHVLSSHSPKALTRREEQLKTYADALVGEGFTVRSRFRTGQPVPEILTAADSLEADYLALAWDRQGVLKRALMGSIQEDVLRLTRVPVYVHKSRDLLDRKTSLDAVLYATDFKSTDAKVMPYLVDSDFAAETLYLLHVGERAPDPDTEAMRRERALKNLERLAGQCRHAYTEVIPLEAVGPTNKVIVRQAHRNKVDLVVLGKADSVHPLRQIIGSTAEAIPNRVRCSVFLVPSIRKRRPSTDHEPTEQ
ncbi:MAG: universal stress protein [Desulfatibacillaceae bacterium]